MAGSAAGMGGGQATGAMGAAIPQGLGYSPTRPPSASSVIGQNGSIPSMGGGNLVSPGFPGSSIGNYGYPVNVPNGNARPQSFNIDTQMQQGLQGAMQGTQRAMNYQPQQVNATGYTAAQAGSQGYDAAQAVAERAKSQGYNAERIAGVGPIQEQSVAAGQLSGTDLSAYLNPYEQNVISGLQSDALKSQQMASNQLGAQATQAGAFGGSRHGIAEGQMTADIQSNLANQIAGLRQSGFQNAQQMALSDIGNRMRADLANQQANLQAQTTTGQQSLQSQLANQAAANQAAQFGAGAANTAALQNAQLGTNVNLQNMSQMNQARQFGANAANTAALQNMNAMNQARQFGAQQQMTAQQLNQAAGLQANQQRLGAAGQMSNLGQQAFDIGRTNEQDLRAIQREKEATNQALIDAAKGQYAGYTGAPQNSLSMMAQALGLVPNANTTTNTKQPGVFDYLTLAATAAGR